jgi:hypothetical protein
MSDLDVFASHTNTFARTTKKYPKIITNTFRILTVIFVLHPKPHQLPCFINQPLSLVESPERSFYKEGQIKKNTEIIKVSAVLPRRSR